MRVQLFTQLQALEQQLADLARERDALVEQFAARDAVRGLRKLALTWPARCGSSGPIVATSNGNWTSSSTGQLTDRS